MHGFISQNGCCIGSFINIVNLYGNDFFCGNPLQNREVNGLICSQPMPAVQNQLCIFAAAFLYHCPRLFHIGQAAVRHRLYADGVFACSVAQFLQLLCSMCNGIVFHQTTVDVVHAEQLAHVEAHLFLIFLFIGTVILRPLHDIFHLCNLHIVFFKNCQNICIKQTFVQCIHIGFRTQTDTFKACLLGCLHSFLKAALIAQCPRADCDGIFFRHEIVPPL